MTRRRSTRSARPRWRISSAFPGTMRRERPGATVITLEENYRSTQGVLDAANALIGQGQRQYRKVLRASRGSGAPPRYVTVVDDQGQADYIVDARARDARARRGAEAPGRAVQELASQRRAGAGADAAEHSVREIRRPEVSRSGAREGHAGGAALGRQPEESHRGVSRAAAAAGDGAGHRGAPASSVRFVRVFMDDAGGVFRVGGDGRSTGRRLRR